VRASETQIGGDHYKDFPIQPGEFCTKNKLGGLQSSIVGRICRYDKPTGGGLEDLKKIKHEVDLIIEWEGWEEERYWEEKKQQRNGKVDYIEDIEKEVRKLPTRIFAFGLRRCNCGSSAPYINAANGLYWVECPYCHATGGKRLTRASARQAWEKGEVSIDEKKL